jgi:hypothetical protein
MTTTTARPPFEALGRLERALASLPAPPLDRLLRPMDALRRRVLLVAAPRLRAVVVSRSRRVALVGSLSLALALAVTCVRPLWLLALGPLVWGVPHLIADVRYLVARPGLHRRRGALPAVVVGVVGLCLGFGVRAGLAAAATAILASGAPWRRRAPALAACAALLAVAQASPWEADVVFLQAHNLVALGLWIAWRRRAAWREALPIAVFAAGAGLLLTAPVERWLAATGGLDAAWTGLTIAKLGETLSLSADRVTTLRLVLFFAFAQSAHYIAWLRLIPEDDRAAKAPRSFAQSFRALRADVGPAVLWLAVAAVAVIAVTALASVSLGRDVYLGIAYFHGHLELVAAALLGVEGSFGRRGA